jgi:S1-C subfamily serine protease
LLLEVARGGAAALASLLPGDLLVAANGRLLRAPDDLTAALAAGDSVGLDLYRGGIAQLRHVTAQLPPIAVAGRQAVNAA